MSEPTTSSDSRARQELLRYLADHNLSLRRFAEVSGVAVSDLSRYLAEDPDKRTRPKGLNMRLIKQATGGTVTFEMWMEAPEPPPADPPAPLPEAPAAAAG